MAYLDSALHYAHDLNWAFREAEILESKYECYRFSGDAEQALSIMVTSVRIRDSLQMLKNVDQVGQLQVQ